MWMLAWLLLAPLANAVECGEAVSLETLDARMSEAEAAWQDLDESRFRDEVNVLSGLLLPCVREVLPPELSAKYHRLMAVYLDAGGDEDGGAASIRAARRTQPDASLDPALIPEDHRLAAAYAAAPIVAKTHNSPEPKFGRIAFDGQFTRARPLGAPAIVQLFDDQGQALSTSYLGAGASLPDYVAVPRMRNALITCAAASGAAAVGGFAWAGASRGSLYAQAANPDTDAAKLDSLRARVNVITVLSTVLVGGASGCGASAVLVGSR